MVSLCSTAEYAVRFCDTPIDWSATGDFIGGIGTVLGAVAVIVTATKAADTFRQWKLQRLEDRKMQLAEQALTLVYKLDPAIAFIRNPMVSGEENEAARQTLTDQNVMNDQTPEGRVNVLATAQATLNRIKSYRPLFDNLAEIRPVVRAIFGTETEQSLAVFDKAARDVQGAAVGYAYIRLAQPRSQEEADREWERMQRFQNIIWQDSEFDEHGEPVKDKIKDDCAEAVQKLEQAFQPHFSAPDRPVRLSWYHFFKSKVN